MLFIFYPVCNFLFLNFLIWIFINPGVHEEFEQNWPQSYCPASKERNLSKSGLLTFVIKFLTYLFFG